MKEFIIYFIAVICCALGVHLGAAFLNGVVIEEQNSIIPTIIFVALYCFCIIKLKEYRLDKVYENETKIREDAANKSVIRSLSEILAVLILLVLILLFAILLLEINQSFGCAFIIAIIDFPLYYKGLALRKIRGNLVETKIKNAVKLISIRGVYACFIIVGIYALADITFGLAKIVMYFLPICIIIIIFAFVAQGAPTEEEELLQNLEELKRKLDK